MKSEELIEQMKGYMAGHITEETIDTYLHLAMPASALIVSPIDELMKGIEHEATRS